jgi:hypothetical protein
MYCGWYPERKGYTFEEMREIWHEYRDELMAGWQHMGRAEVGCMPWGWWVFEAGVPVGEVPSGAEEELPRLREMGLVE